MSGRSAADIRLNPGEYAVYEGEPALFVVLEGTIEVIKIVDGIERKIGARLPGKIFGEVPLVFGTQFQAGFRASAPTRVLKLEARPYYAVAASSPEACRGLRRSRPAPGSSCSATVGTAPASTFAVFSSATRSPSPGSRRTTPISPTIGQGGRRERASARRCGSPTA
jgi:hypothetical protein